MQQTNDRGSLRPARTDGRGTPEGEAFVPRVGDRVRVNCFRGRVKAVSDTVTDGFGNPVPLRNPVYTVVVDTSRTVTWVEPPVRAHVPQTGRRVTLKLWADEFLPAP